MPLGGILFMTDSAESAGARNAEVIRRYLRVFETRDIAELKELVAEDVLVHGAGHHVQGRHYTEGSVLTPGLTSTISSQSVTVSL
jgi:hypothetical protein